MMCHLQVLVSRTAPALFFCGISKQKQRYIANCRCLHGAAPHLGAGPLVGGDNVEDARHDALAQAVGNPRLQEALVHSRPPAAAVAAAQWRVRHLPCLRARTTFHDIMMVNIIIISHAFLPIKARCVCRQAAGKGCQNPTPCWTRQIQARPNQPWARCSEFIPPPGACIIIMYIKSVILLHTWPYMFPALYISIYPCHSVDCSAGSCACEEKIAMQENSCIMNKQLHACKVSHNGLQHLEFCELYLSVAQTGLQSGKFCLSQFELARDMSHEKKSLDHWVTDCKPNYHSRDDDEHCVLTSFLTHTCQDNFWQQSKGICCTWRSATTFLRELVPRKTITMRPGPQPRSAIVSCRRSHITCDNMSCGSQCLPPEPSSFCPNQHKPLLNFWPHLWTYVSAGVHGPVWQISNGSGSEAVAALSCFPAIQKCFVMWQNPSCTSNTLRAMCFFTQILSLHCLV